MYKVKHLTESLAAKELNACDAAFLIKSTISSLQKIRSKTENILILKIQPMYKILSVSLKVNTSQDLSKAFYLFPPMSHGAKLLDFDTAVAEWKILGCQCVNENLKCIIVHQKSEEVKHILPWANWFCRLSFTSPVTTASSERTFSKLKLIKHNLRFYNLQNLR